MKKIILLFFICNCASLHAMMRPQEASYTGHPLYMLAQWMHAKLGGKSQPEKPAASPARQPVFKKPTLTHDAPVVVYAQNGQVVLVVPDGTSVTVISADQLRKNGIVFFPPFVENDEDSDDD